MREGLSNINSRSSSYSSYNQYNTPGKPDTSTTGWESVRVLDIILDENHPRFNELGGYSSIGTIIFQSQKSPLNNPDNNYNYASPLSPNNKSYPLINEVVMVFKMSIEGNNVGNKSKYYYLSSINLWNTPHHNALPNEGKDLRENIDNEGNIRINLTSQYYEGEFNEKNNINPLKHFPGDIITESRFGSSIRLGSTYKSSTNEWSKTGNNSDPIMILRNGTTVDDSLSSWIPITENIKGDYSNIYLTSTQQLPIKYPSNFSSLPHIPIEANLYNKPQIILTSDRVLLNAKKDGVLINGEEFVHIHSLKYIGLNSIYGITLSSNEVKLGSSMAEEQLVLGNSLMKSLSKLSNTLSKLVDILSYMKEYPGGSPIDSPLGAAISILKPEVDALVDLYKSDKILSKTSKTI